LKIQAPNVQERVNFEKLISIDEIHRHRMQADPEQMLTALLSEKGLSPKSEKRALSMTYHPDRYSDGDRLLQDLMNKRMQEINAAYDALERKVR
jgi:preprotein translocase subunit Sec63